MKGQKIMFTIFLVVLTIALLMSTCLYLLSWIKDEPEKEVVYEQTNPDLYYNPITVPPPRYDFQEEEIYLLAQLLCGQEGVDGDGEYDFEHMLEFYDFSEEEELKAWEEINKVLYVVMNRVMAEGLYANNVTEVVLQPGAFTVMPRNLKSEPCKKVIEVVRGWCNNYTEIQTIPLDHYWFSADGKGGNVTRNTF